MTTLSLERIDETLDAIQAFIRKTPSVALPSGLVPGAASVSAKYELMQVTGTFKARGAIANLLALDAAARARGVTAVSAGNHAIATAYAAQQMQVDAKVVMTATAPAVRVARCQAFGAEVVLADDVHQAFARMHEIAEQDGRTVIHPFEGVVTATATAGVGREFAAQVPQLDVVIVPVGGGGLAAGVAAAIKLSLPRCEVWGVEPEGANSMSRSLAAGEAVSIERVHTIADSLGAPMAMPVSVGLCREFLDGVVEVTDSALVQAMKAQHRELGLAVEPACAAALAAATGPLLSQLEGKHVGLVFCGSNIDAASWCSLVQHD